MPKSPAYLSPLWVPTAIIHQSRACRTPPTSYKQEVTCHFLQLLALEIRQMIYRYLLLPCQKRCPRPPESRKGRPGDTHLEILRVNRQISREAVSIFYSEAIVVVEAPSLFDLSNNSFPTPGTLHARVWTCCPENRSTNFWRYNPLHGIGERHHDGTVAYNTPEWEGRMYPHVFARFSKVDFIMRFDKSLLPLPDPFVDVLPYLKFNVKKESLCVQPADITAFSKFLSSTTFMADFAKILGNSTLIQELCMVLDIQVDIWYDIPDFNTIDEQSQFYSNMEQCFPRMLDAANSRAAETFFDCGDIFSPLRGLSNVKTLRFSFNMQDLDHQYWKPSPKCAELIQDLQSAVANNFKEGIKKE